MYYVAAGHYHDDANYDEMGDYVFRIMTMIMRIKPVHMIGLRTSGPAKERE